MAFDITEANAVSQKYYDDTITSQVYDEMPFYVKLKQKGNISWSGGTQIQFPIRYTELGRARAVTSREQLAYGSKDTRTGGVLDWKYLEADTMISWDERVKNSGKGQIIDLLKDKAQELSQDIAEKWADDCFATTQSTKTFSGLTTIVDSADTYAGVAVADAAEWAAQEDNTTTRLSLFGATGSLATMFNAATFGKNKPDLIVTTRNLFSKFESLVEPQFRYQDNDMAKVGFANLKWHDATFLADPHCPALYMYGLCTDQFEIRYHPDYNMKVSPWFKLEQIGLPEAMVKVVTWAGNIICRMRKVNFKYDHLDYTL